MGAILADDMGLGKTVQALAWIEWLRERDPDGGPTLVVCPASVVYNWQREADVYHINTILVPLGRYDGLELFPVLSQFCDSAAWAPVYLDENSAIFVRRTSDTKALIDRIQVSCAAASLPTSVSGKKDEAFNQWANAAAVLYALGRDQDAYAAASNSLSIFPGNSISRLIRARVLVKMGRTSEAESEFLAAAELEDNPGIWLSLARMYRIQKRYPAANQATERAVELSPRPFSALFALGNLYLEEHAPNDALKVLDRAQKALPDQPDAVGNATLAELAQSRALAWRDLGNLDQAVSDQERAVQLAPELPRHWLLLADLYERQGRTLDAEKARAQAAATKTR
jgi:tetratricopeptide (TPR) repeat protein